ncbi:MAG: endonuclease III [Planctomycetaceae bacterium]
MSSKIPPQNAETRPNTPPAKRSGRESVAARKARTSQIVQELARLFPTADCALHHNSPFQLLTATILSAQCTDERVNQATPELFRRFPNAHALALASQPDVEAIVKPLGFFRAKAKNLRGMASALVERHGGEVPPSLDLLVQLPGVGRKTASVVLGTWFQIPSGVVVDTHVSRLTNLLGLVKSTNPEIIERELMQLLPQEEWIMFSHRLIHHGRKTCVARRPNCTACQLLPLCRRTGLPPLK